MQASDIMSRTVVTVRENATIVEAIGLMLDHHVSGLPVLDATGELCGVVTEGDLLRRHETNTEPHHTWWWNFVHGPGAQAAEYVRANTRRVSDLMTATPVTVGEATPAGEIADLMERKRVKRLPVVKEGVVVGIVSRADMLRALAAELTKPHMAKPGEADEVLSAQITGELDKQGWFKNGRIEVDVEDGVVTLRGSFIDARERDAARVAAENVPGVKAVRDMLEFVNPNAGLMYG
jgi:CBS domain-containing protein